MDVIKHAASCNEFGFLLVHYAADMVLLKTFGEPNTEGGHLRSRLGILAFSTLAADFLLPPLRASRMQILKLHIKLNCQPCLIY
jgi:hypothetical protein